MLKRIVVLMRSSVDKMSCLVIGKTLHSLVSRSRVFGGLFCYHSCCPSYLQGCNPDIVLCQTLLSFHFVIVVCLVLSRICFGVCSKVVPQLFCLFRYTNRFTACLMQILVFCYLQSSSLFSSFYPFVLSLFNADSSDMTCAHSLGLILRVNYKAIGR